MNKQQIEVAVGAGLELLGEKSEVSIPAKLNDGVFLLKQLLIAIAQGQIGLTPTMQGKPEGVPDLPKQPGTPDPATRAAARKKRPKKK